MEAEETVKIGSMQNGVSFQTAEIIYITKAEA